MKVHEGKVTCIEFAIFRDHLIYIDFSTLFALPGGQQELYRRGGGADNSQRLHYDESCKMRKPKVYIIPLPFYRFYSTLKNRGVSSEGRKSKSVLPTAVWGTKSTLNPKSKIVNISLVF